MANQISKSDAISKIEKLIAIIQNIKYDSPEFLEWRRNAKIVIANIFGDESQQSTDFEAMSYRFLKSRTGTPRIEQIEAFQEETNRAKSILKSIIQEINKSWKDDESAIEPSTTTASMTTSIIFSNRTTARKVFISYSSDDSRKVEHLRKIINQTKLFQPVIIADKRQSFKTLTKKVIEGIEESEIFIPILTKKSMAAQWVNQEVGYAKALSRKIMPLIQAGIFRTLKGFIHNQDDQPYQFKGSNQTGENKSFNKQAQLLISDLISEDIKYIFSNKWKNEWFDEEKIKEGEEIFEIQNSNQYFIGNRHAYNITNIRFDFKENKLLFDKANLKGETIFQNKVKIVSNKFFEGEEISILEDGSEHFTINKYTMI